MATSETARPAGSWLAGAAGIVGLVVEGVYLVIIDAEGDLGAGRVTAVSVFILASSGLALLGAFAHGLSTRLRLLVLAAATGGLASVGAIGIFSIGLPLLGAGAMCGAAWVEFARATRPVPAGAPLLSALAAIGPALLVFMVALS